MTPCPLTAVTIIHKNFNGVRKLSIIRGLLQEVDHTATQQMIFHHTLERERWRR